MPNCRNEVNKVRLYKIQVFKVSRHLHTSQRQEKDLTSASINPAGSSSCTNHHESSGKTGGNGLKSVTICHIPAELRPSTSSHLSVQCIPPSQCKTQIPSGQNYLMPQQASSLSFPSASSVNRVGTPELSPCCSGLPGEQQNSHTKSSEGCVQTKAEIRPCDHDLPVKGKGLNKARFRMIEDFILPALNDERYGEKLKWEDKAKNIFCVQWKHQMAAKWSLEDAVVFQDWDKLKGHFRPEHKYYYRQAKARFRCALHRMPSVKVLKSSDKHLKKYELTKYCIKKKHFDDKIRKDRCKMLCSSVKMDQGNTHTSSNCSSCFHYECQRHLNYGQQSPTISNRDDCSDNYSDASLESFTNNSLNEEFPSEGRTSEYTDHTYTKLFKNSYFGSGNTADFSNPINCDPERISLHYEDMNTSFEERASVNCTCADKKPEMISIKCESAKICQSIPMECKAADINLESFSEIPKHSGNNFEMISIKCEPPDNLEMLTEISEYSDNNFEMVSIKCEPPDNDLEVLSKISEHTDNNFEMVSIKCEPPDNDLEVLSKISEHTDNNFEMVSIKCEPPDNGLEVLSEISEHSDNNFEMVSIKCEPPDNDLEVLSKISEHTDNNFEMVSIKCEPPDNGLEVLSEISEHSDNNFEMVSIKCEPPDNNLKTLSKISEHLDNNFEMISVKCEPPDNDLEMLSKISERSYHPVRLESTVGMFSITHDSSGSEFEHIPIKCEPADNEVEILAEVCKHSDSNFNMIPVKCEPTDDGFKMIPITCEPIKNFEVVSIKSEPVDNNLEMPPAIYEHSSSKFEMVPVKCELMDKH